ncbi:calcium-binding tyrosine phosphorylation-regulated protein isoform X1 [Cervus elaphus]|uniref:calcium-binding tyrosine phosphorylation-regulated protein isoform X1 n=1 Tax=Cervus elaphus TaxID=9860 RepID=UPI001CC2E751|nr:calcium-binding tyrosine phosphorylation-regulated protein isoform X1 [Cervus elaphus]XP_043745638.1 calcium-binding tyrosine phosphorylation-regulated protein isoform X1 [Cervus elaphus]XP_043745639.1 calcium-binding tyrosine phosphorylation-regulated protein isoform X1 [Cervus elaphus]XP_043745640.1 calcium-binding tyrosine phosphorylation-regulated protein isoform X1 [Cervus elaphus]XP_043745641.1 calcium-binding tyrosine phosphorylation-regulated protein isoform X1 [Cervus elaphus]XP_04
MISSKPRLVVPYGLKTLLEGVSRAILKTNPPNITQFAAVYFRELILFREGHACLDIKDLVKQFHQIKVEKWSEGTAQEKKAECVKEPERASTISLEPKRMEKSTDTEEDNIAAPLFSNKTTQFPSVQAELVSEPEDASEALRGPSKPATPPSSPVPAAVTSEFAYVPADPAQFAAQMLGNVPSVHSDQSEILMVDVATSMPGISEEMLSSKATEENVVATPSVCSGKMVAEQVVSEKSVHVRVGSKAESPTASSFPLQGEQEPPACDHASEVPLQADIEVTSTMHIASIYNDEPVIEGVTYVEQLPEQIVIPFSDHVARLKGKEQSPPHSPILVVGKTASGGSEKSVGSAKFVQLESTKYDSVHVEADGSTKAVSSEKSMHLEVEIFALAPGSAGQESGGNPASQETEVKPTRSGSIRSSSGPQPPVPEGLYEPEMEPEREAAPSNEV